MKCPFCGHLEDKVIDSRTSKEGDAIRRRRECLKCERRFTSYERIEEVMPMVVKKDGRREPFDRQKILHGLKKACEKRPVSTEQYEDVVNRIERKVMALGVREAPSSLIGEEVMAALKEMDVVAYVRFASVYRQFKDISELMDEVKTLFEGKGKNG
ncbi:MAG: transcriptional regulator NrdR [Nitrospiraceae bacterium]|nr:transcriptional regulator NrdR [Nitrospiraceae bacterium]MDA8324993.1 transcriptional regulator NrdR [Nitrospiraceae bacterium]